MPTRHTKFTCSQVRCHLSLITKATRFLNNLKRSGWDFSRWCCRKASQWKQQQRRSQPSNYRYVNKVRQVKLAPKLCCNRNWTCESCVCVCVCVYDVRVSSVLNNLQTIQPISLPSEWNKRKCIFTCMNHKKEQGKAKRKISFYVVWHCIALPHRPLCVSDGISQKKTITKCFESIFFVFFRFTSQIF